MKFYGDFHIHSSHSRACSKDLDIKNLEKYARMKGLHIIGTGDFQHPKWIKELKTNLTDDGSGILKTKTDFPFICTSEISLMYTQDKKGRRIHFLLFAPNLEVVDQITEALKKRGRIDYDGRPIFGFSAIELVEMMNSISEKIEIVPAHSWTPWFGIFGEKTGFDSLEECFQEKTKYIHAIETGLSSDPAMNWRVPFLDKINLLSFSDLHSYWPWRIGREATIFNLKNLSYDSLLKAIRTSEGLTGTLEFFPEEGKYHWDGHRNCNVVLSPQESQKLGGICPKCGNKLTLGVEYRVEQLAKRPIGFKPKNAKEFYSLIPLSEIIQFHCNQNTPASKKVWEIYTKLIKEFNNELNILLDVSQQDLEKVVEKELADKIVKVRNKEVYVFPGFDGEYGKIFFDKKEYETALKTKDLTKKTKTQKNLLDF